MTMLGMDVEALAALAIKLQGQAVEIQSVTTTTDAVVHETTTEWFGADAQQFASSWQGDHRASLLRAGEMLTAMLTCLRANIAQQQAASGVAGASAAPHSSLTPDGQVRVTEQSQSSGAGPHNTQELVGLVQKAYNAPGGVSVTFSGSGANRQAIVAVSGTEYWLPGSKNVDDISTNISDVLGISNLKEEAIKQAMLDAGVTPQDNVMLVGHSQGGADVINFAADNANSGQFHIGSVLTAAAPETVKYPPSNIPVLELRTPGDVVPSLGVSSLVGAQIAGPAGASLGAQLHDWMAPDNVQIVNLSGPTTNPLTAHQVRTCEQDIAASAGNPAIQAFANQNSSFLNGAPSTTQLYRAERTHTGLDNLIDSLR
jgi:uncharacterized protein YukE